MWRLPVFFPLIKENADVAVVSRGSDESLVKGLHHRATGFVEV